MTKLYCWIVSGLKSEEGAAMVEYGLLVALIAVVVAAGATVLGGKINSLFGTTISGKLP